MPSAAARREQPQPAWQLNDLIRTKLYIPQARANLVPRPALIARLNEGLARKLTLISAPAGFGKTTLLSAWIAASQVPAAWVSLDARDNDPLRFVTYLVAALETLELGVGRGLLAALRAERPSGAQPRALEALLTRLINDITEIAEDFVLVLDDYHLIQAEPVHAALTFLLDHLPPQLHLVLTSRTAPPLALAQQRARGQLVELRAADLRFSTDEVAAFLNETMGLALSPDEIAALEARSEGWVASLQLAALSLRDNQRVPEFIQAFTGSHRYVVDYLAEQVLLQQPPAIQAFLLETSILERLSGPLCDALLDEGRRTNDEGWTFVVRPSSSVLEQLERANLFVTSLDDQRQWFRYHPLFADFLQERLRQVSPQRLPELHRRAAGWYEQHALMEDAVQHALAAQDYALATRLIEQVAETLWARSQILTMLRWMKAMPEAFVRSQPRLCVQYAWAFAINGHLDEVEPFLQAAEAHLAGVPLPPHEPDPLGEAAWDDSPRRLVVQVDILRAFASRFNGELEQAVAHAERALAQTPSNCRRTRAIALIMLGHARLLLGEFAAADQALTEARQDGQAIRHMAVHLSATNYLAQLRVVQGRLNQALALMREALQLVGDDGSSLSGIERIGLGTLLREQNELEAAAGLIDSGLQLAEAGGDFTFLRDGYLARARLEQARGALEAALLYVTKAEQVARRSSRNRDLDVIGAYHARLWLAQGGAAAEAAAAEWARASGLSAADELTFLREYEHLTLARVYLAQRRWPEARRLAERVLARAEAEGRLGRVLDAQAALAMILDAQGDGPRALATLRHALALAEPEGYVRLFADEGPRLADLLTRLRPSLTGRLRAYADKLAGCMDVWRHGGVDAKTATPPYLQTSTPALPEPLSDREQTVLRLIAAGLSNQDIADELVVAQSTIQWHVKNIYSKLNVHSRTQAALLARELRLVA